MDERIEKALNGQLNAELYSAYLYWAMAAYLKDEDLPGMANWMENQAKEELNHTVRFYKYIGERGGRVTMEAIERPPDSWDDVLSLFEDVYAHEQKVTSLIHALVDLSDEVRDHATSNFLQWFVAEQVEEEDSAAEVLGKVRRSEGSPQALMMVDEQLSQRVAPFVIIPPKV